MCTLLVVSSSSSGSRVRDVDGAGGSRVMLGVAAPDQDGTTADMMTRIALLAALVAAPSLAAAQRAIDLPIGATAPDMPLETLDGKPANLSAWLGKTPLLMEVWATC
jgi:hypothetical protein